MGHTKVEQNVLDEMVQVQEGIKIDSKHEQTYVADTVVVS